ncbi:immune inhibitor A [Clostridium estertheticum]|uniref:immune inhibitor A domain-containing protein n=1 Tax=Clostridium estertheticum TaxID=238834 RepID=UPI0013E998D7|nr:immune inhibitor A domain-containing protein [Clostridium estertheticum]MBZ9686624.1 immune inhibitor A [Clostridium estertheticum]
MVSKKLLGVIMSFALVANVMSFKPASSVGQANLTSGNLIQEDKGTVDLAIANEDRLIEMLKKSGKIAQNATQEEALQVVRAYLKGMEKDAVGDPSKLTTEEKTALNKIKIEVQSKNPKQNKKFPATPSKTWDGKVKSDKILVLLEDFNDYKHNMITPDETDMYYKEYAQKHYQDMLFGKNGYAGPSGETLISMKQYYEQQSGGSYTVDGTVLGWYTAPNTAKYYGEDTATSHNKNAKTFVYEGLKTAAKDASVNLADYDLEDPYDIDGDGNINEPDGIIDHLMVIHAGVGQEAGGGVLGDDSIWSHSSKLSTGPVAIPGATSNSTNFGGKLAAYAYTIMPEDGNTGVFCHEFGHDLGLPDEYDTDYTGVGEPVEYWSIMSSGSWAGKIPGAEPTGFSPYGKLYFQETYGGNWMHGSEVNINDIPKSGLKYVLDQAAIKGKNNDFVKVNLPEKSTKVNTPASGTKEYFSGKGDDMNNSMWVNLDLTGKATAKLTFNTLYDIEQDYDYAYINVKVGSADGVTVPGNITTTTNPEGANLGNGITGSSNGWVKGEFDLTQFAGQKIQLSFNYVTDAGLSMPGFYIDDIAVQADGAAIFSDNVEAAPKFTMDKFTVSDGNMYTSQYYILEWRNQVGADLGLAHIKRGNSLMSYDPGLLVWYVDNSFTDNWTGIHPGQGYLGLVDADQSINMWNYADKTMKPAVASTRYQLHDAAFSQRKTENMLLDYGTQTLTDTTTQTNHTFNDSKSYMSTLIPDAGRIVPKFGLEISVNGEANDRSSATIMLKVK